MTMLHGIRRLYLYPCSTEAERIANELVKLFACVGIPDEILSDQGTNFMSNLLQIYLTHWAKSSIFQLLFID